MQLYIPWARRTNSSISVLFFAQIDVKLFDITILIKLLRQYLKTESISFDLSYPLSDYIYTIVS